MKTLKESGLIFFLLTLLSPMISFTFASQIGEANVFGIAGIIRYSWVMWLFIPFGIVSIVIGVCLKRKNLKHKKNIIVAFICIPLLLIFGSYRFIFQCFSYDVDKVAAIESKISIDLPNDVKVATDKLNSYDESYVKIVSEESKKLFEQELANNPLWQNSIPPEIKGSLPIDIQYETENFEYFLFYDVTNDAYNTYPQNGQCYGVFIAYDRDLQRFIMLDNYIILSY